ncbi:phenylacetate--CoA ligase family protein [Corynebacterium bovis]|uniref:phenylacetate--CoA ligase family protein n=2 Tax=Corynebacterium bovis TaxID=36808 RepID=UPI000F62E3E6|nr:AMP-binding protein [Corynebacterium bovis]RRO88563.1 AMP-dependent synthetase [Corynebacterium bovis]RRO94378.1 AMP-dependent synthetase [Corynebacterium bovis]RRO95725.1 AMP-dependent synthetase [Corynebacterium bovis]RRO99306.1 AMP-dependent synthetase [Corynebacterium bovis]RRO99492.1 AMP-dependent synthetase [Corynebacterium bovis]
MPVHPLAEHISFARKHSPFYRDLYRELPPEVHSPDELPVTDTVAFWHANTPTGNSVLTAPLNDALVLRSGGTTGAPKFSFWTAAEWAEFTAAFGHGLAAAGLPAGSRVADLFFVGDLYASFTFVMDSLARCPVQTVRLPVAGSTPPDHVTDTLRQFHVDVVAGLPTTLRTLAEHVIATGEPLDEVRTILFGGEPVFGDQKVLLDAAFPRADVRSLGYASVDAGLLGTPVPGDDPRVHRVCAPYTVTEIVDDVTGAPVTDPGVPGDLVVTDLRRRLMPVLRYPVGDRAEWVDASRTTFRLLGRGEAGVRIGHVTLYTGDVRDVLAGVDTDGEVTDHQLVVRHHDGRDGLILRAAVADPEADHSTLAGRFVAALDVARPNHAEAVAAGDAHPARVEWVRHSDLAVNPRSGKLVRVVDERPLS